MNSDATNQKRKRPIVRPIGATLGAKTTPAPASAPKSDGSGWSKTGSWNVAEMGVKVGTKGITTGSAGTASSKPAPAPFASGAKEAIDPDDLVEEKTLGKGASGLVILCRDKKTTKLYAVKIINLSQIQASTDSKMIAEEIKSIDNACPYLVSAHTAYLRDKRLHIVQEYIDKGSLYDVLRCHNAAIPEGIVAKIAEQVLNGLAYLHGASEKNGKSKMHRDMKPANILVCSSGIVKISDFGVATTDSTKGHSTFVGTTTYMSPERIKGEKYSVKSDVWAAGLTFAECLLGYYPFRSRTTFIELLVQITKEQKFEFPPGTSEDCKNFIMAGLKQRPDDRPTAQQLLEHPFITNNQTTTAQVAQFLAGVNVVPEENSKGQTTNRTV